MRKFPLATMAGAVLLAAACSSSDNEAPDAASPANSAAPMAMVPDTTPQGKINSAISAGPSEITSAATIADFDAMGEMTELRPGTNGWICTPDMASSPGPDPMCADASWQSWFSAYMAKTTPNVTGVGVAYMLQGGSDASNVDPFATEPTAGNQWITSGAHIMVISPNPTMLDAYGTDPSPGVPWVMWKGTPYAHLMVPIQASM